MRLEPDWFRLITSQLWQVTLLIPIAIFLLRGVCRARSHLAYGVLLVVLVKCVTPPIFTSDVGVFPWAERHASRIAPRIHAASPVEADSSPATGASTAAATAPIAPGASSEIDLETRTFVASESSTTNGAAESALMAQHTTSPRGARPLPGSVDQWLRNPGTVLLALWCLGIVAFAAWVAFSWRQLRRLCGGDSAPATVQQLADRLAADLGLSRIPRLRVSDELVMPFAFGVRRPTVLIPRAVLGAGERDNLVLVLAHELNHLRRRDTAVGALQLLIQGIWWFHPFVWWLNREIRRYREHCCDEEVLARLECRPQNYARCLINVLELNERGSSHFGLAGMSPFEVTSQRLRNIMRPGSPFRRRMSIGSWVATACIAAVVLPGARGLRSSLAEASIADGAPSSSLEPVGGMPADAPAPELTQQAETNPLEPRAFRDQRQAGANVPYQLTIEVDHGREVETLSATPTLNLRNGGGGRAEFFVTRDMLSSVRSTKPRREREFDPFRFREVPRFPRMAYPTGSWRGPHVAPTLPGEHLVRFDDGGGSVSEQVESEPLPYLLGSLADLLIPRRPPGGESQWSETIGTEVLNIRAKDDGPSSIPRVIPAGDAQPESLAAEQTTVATLAQNAAGGWELRRHRELTTIQQIDGGPRLALSEDAVWQFSAPGEMPLRLDATAKLIVREDHGGATLPIRITAERLPAP